MKKFKGLNTVPFLIAIIFSLILAKIILPNTNFGRVVFIIIFGVSMVSFGNWWINQFRIKQIRNQLFEIFKTLEEFDIDQPRKVEFKDSPFPIFNELNEYLLELIDRIRADYLANKEFTANASHELQTPLAVIRGQVELLIQSKNIGEKEMEGLGNILQNTNRLAKINAALILLSKIENQRFTDVEKISFNKIVKEVLTNFQDLLKIQDIKIRKKIDDNFEWKISQTLAEILVANLIQNAIRHNSSNFIEIAIKHRSLEIANLGKSLEIPPEKLFKRFKRASNKEESLGLGLSIVQRICEQSDLEVQYIYEKSEKHILKISGQRIRQ